MRNVILGVVCLLVWGSAVSATTYYVNPGESIQAAIDGASYGDTVEVSAGTYVENITMKNGVVLRGAGESTTTIDGNDAGTVVYTPGDCDPNTVIDGFTITNGYATDGGGMYNSGDPAVMNCTVSNNVVLEDGGGVYGGGTFINCTISNNEVLNGEGGGMYNEYFSRPTVMNCTISNNVAGEGGGVRGRGSFINCTVSNNEAFNGGGVYGGGSFVNCIVSSNVAWDSGGGMYNDSSSPIVTNCIFTDNSAYSSYGCGVYNDNSSPIVTNCILWGNLSSEYYDDLGSTSIVSYSDVRDGWPGEGNINADPCFVDAGSGDYRLSSGSPCIDAGDNTAVSKPDDLDGRDRIVDGDCNDTEIVDMGAFEFTSAYYGDFDGDCDVEFIDYAIQAEYWLTDEFSVDIAPTPAGDGIVDEKDLAVLCDNWLAGIEP